MGSIPRGDRTDRTGPRKTSGQGVALGLEFTQRPGTPWSRTTWPRADPRPPPGRPPISRTATVWTVLALYVGGLALCALWARRRTKDLADYYVGGRTLPAWILALSYFATFVSTNTFLGHAGKSYDFGVSWLLLGAVLLLFSLVAWRWIGPRVAEVAGAGGFLTVPEFFARRFASPNAGTLAAVLILFDSVWYLTAVFQGAAFSAEKLLDLGPLEALLLVVGVQVAYTLVGGFLSDALTDALQAIVMLAAAFVLPIAFVAAGGGPSTVLERLRTVDAGAEGRPLL